MHKLSLVSIFLFACSSTPNSGPQGSTSAGLSMTVNTLAAKSQIGSVKPQAGRGFMQANVTLTNVDSTPVSIAFPLFSIEMMSGLLVTASSDTALIATRCAEDQQLSPAGTRTCDLAFEVPTTETPVAIDFHDPISMAVSRALLPALSAPSLADQCTSIFPLEAQISRPGCQSCVLGCYQTKPTCTTAENNCVSGCGAASAAACTCVDACATDPTCRAGLSAVFQCLSDNCSTACAP